MNRRQMRIHVTFLPFAFLSTTTLSPLPRRLWMNRHTIQALALSLISNEPKWSERQRSILDRLIERDQLRNLWQLLSVGIVIYTNNKHRESNLLLAAWFYHDNIAIIDHAEHAENSPIIRTIDSPVGPTFNRSKLYARSYNSHQQQQYWRLGRERDSTISSLEFSQARYESERLSFPSITILLASE